MGSTKIKLRKKKVFYYNFPFSDCIKTNIGTEFLKLVSRHFSKSVFYGTIFSRNTINISYSYMSNLEKEISNHNHKTLKNSNKITDEDSKSCNCRSKANCLFSGECLTKAVIYKTSVVHKNKEIIYIGSSGRQFKARFYEHTQFFRSAMKKESLRLSRFIHKIKNETSIGKNNQIGDYSTYKSK